MLSTSGRLLTLFMSLVVCTLLVTIAHAQTQPGASNGGLTVTLPTWESGAPTKPVAGTRAAPSTPVTPGAWLQAFLLPSWRPLFARDEPVRKPVRDRSAVRTR
jgi:hypothetical protein